MKGEDLLKREKSQKGGDKIIVKNENTFPLLVLPNKEGISKSKNKMNSNSSVLS